MDHKKVTEVVDFIEKHPEQHSQKNWAQRNPCGTTACFAGHTALLNGYQAVFGMEGRPDPFTAARSWAVVHPARPTEHLSYRDVAQKILQLTDVQVEDLFYNATSIDDIRLLLVGYGWNDTRLTREELNSQ